jgi:stage III sporulation protein AH
MKEKSKGFIKKMVKKNQVIIAALAVMIIIAGYLNLTGDTNSELLNGLSATEESLDSESSADVDVELADGEAPDSAIVSSDNEELAEEGTMGSAASESEESVESSGTNLDISDEDIYTVADSEASSDNLEVVSDSLDDGEAEIGEAVMASTVLGSGFFSNAKLDREQVRSVNKATLQGIINDSAAGEEAKAEAVAALLEMTEAASLEDELETLLEAKGFETVCYIDGENIDVVVEAAEMTDGDVAKIEDVIMRKTGFDVSGIVISNVVTEE